MLRSALLFALPFTALLSFLALPLGIRLAKRYGWLDLPSSRKRHQNPVPIVGGACIFAAWTLGMALLRYVSPEWSDQDTRSLLVVGASIWALVALGLWDDIRGLSPKIKLMVQFAVAAGTIAFEPNLRALCASQATPLPGALVIPLIYAPALIWLVGVMNAINLIDGIDGFAGGTSLLIAVATLVLNLLPGNGNSFGASSLVLVLFPIAMFLRHNWSPAKIFLGDNGSLSLGYLLALNGLIHRPNPLPQVAIPCMFIMYAYPILDMGLCTYRRFRNGYPLFKADRSHLHHRVQRLGLTRAKTTALLLCIVAYSQIMAIFINSVHFQLMLVTIGAFALSMFIFLFLLRSVEEWRAGNLVTTHGGLPVQVAPDQAEHTVLTINLNPLLEVGLLEEKTEVGLILSSLSMMIARSIRKRDRVYFRGTQLCIALEGRTKTPEDCAVLVQRIRRKLSAFQELYGIQYSIVGLPVSFSASETFPVPAALPIGEEPRTPYAS